LPEVAEDGEVRPGVAVVGGDRLLGEGEPLLEQIGARRSAGMVGLGAAVERRAGGGGAGKPGRTEARIGTGRARREEEAEHGASSAVARPQSSRLERLMAGGVLGS